MIEVFSEREFFERFGCSVFGWESCWDGGVGCWGGCEIVDIKILFLFMEIIDSDWFYVWCLVWILILVYFNLIFWGLMDVYCGDEVRY